MNKSDASRRWAPWLAFSLVGVAACQVVVGETELTTVHCKAEGAEGPPACAVGQVCLNGVCVSKSSAAGGGGGTGGTGETGGTGGTGETGGTDGGGTGGGGTGGTGGVTGGTGGSPDAGDASDVGLDVVDDVVPDVPTDTPIDSPPDVAPDAPLLGIGAACSDDGQCESKRCYDLPGGNRRCTSLCCSSFECYGGTVCVPFNGLNVCVPPSDVGIPGTANVPQGQACSAGDVCRSGRCSTSGTCIDVCCTNANCNDNAACAWQNYGGDSGWFCAPYSVGSYGGHFDTCEVDTDCDGRNCYSGLSVRCMAACCSDADCPEPFPLSGGHCDYLSDNGVVIRQCFSSTLSSGAARACCSDANCSPGQHCVPTQDEAWNTNTLPPYKDDVWGMRCQ